MAKTQLRIALVFLTSLEPSNLSNELAARKTPLLKNVEWHDGDKKSGGEPKRTPASVCNHGWLNGGLVKTTLTVYAKVPGPHGPRATRKFAEAGQEDPHPGTTPHPGNGGGEDGLGA